MIAQSQRLAVRSATVSDLQNLASLVHFEPHVHRHLDWRPPLDWVGHEPYLLAERNNRVLAALACPPDPPNVAWIRLFAVASRLSLENTWSDLWSHAQAMLQKTGRPIRVAAIPLQRWFRQLLEGSEFVSTHSVVVLSWRGDGDLNIRDNGAVFIRPMNLDDLASVVQIDSTAFGEVWQNSLACLEIAYRQAAIATVAELSGKIVGYQISTATTLGGHLARLAVQPEYQGEGIGFALLQDMLSQFKRRGAFSVSVNTQHDNLISLSLYKKAGFKRTNEEYPVYQFAIM